MNPKLVRLRAEYEKNRCKISELSAKNNQLARKIRELENAEIVGLVREKGYTLDDFIELLRSIPQVKDPQTEQPKGESSNEYQE